MSSAWERSREWPRNWACIGGWFGKRLGGAAEGGGGAAAASYGLTMTIQPGLTACVACVYPAPLSEAQPTCETAGVLGPATALIASLQSAAMRLLCGAESESRITTADVWTGEIRQIRGNAPDPDCRACGRRLERLGEVRANRFALRFETPPYLITVFPDGRVIVKGTTDPALARSLDARFIGN